MDSNIYLNSDELAHWGIKGMRWGIRRYQNKDGSLTAKGRKRYNEEMAKLAEEEKTLKRRKATQAKLDRLEAKRKALADQKKELDDADAAKSKKGKGDDADAKSDKPTKKSVKDMTDEELASALVRSRMESEYARLNPEPAPKESFTSRFMNDAVKPAAVNAGRNFLENAIKKMGEKMLADKIDPDSVEGLKKQFEKLDLKQKIDKINNPDKYLSEEDKNKRQEREHKEANWKAQLEGKGYNSAKDKAEAEYAAREAARKAAADESARKANESKSHEYYNSTYSNKGVGSESVGSNSGSVQKLLGSGNVSSGQSWTQNLLGSGTSVKALTSGSSDIIKNGEKYIGDAIYEDVD